MAVGLSNSLANLLLNPYAQTTLQAAQQNRAPIDPLKAGATITARYTLEEDGALSLRDVNVVDEAGDATSEQSQQQRQQTLAQQNRRNATFTDLIRPKATLNPADEVALFAAPANGPLQLAAPQTKQQPGDEPGITDVIFDEATPADDVSLAAQKQQRVASLYARNADITFNVDPVYSQAA